MQNIYLVSIEPVNTQDVVSKIEELVQDSNYRIVKTDTYQDNDIDLYLDSSGDDSNLIGIEIISEEEFYFDPYKIEDEKYYYSIIVRYDVEVLNNAISIVQNLIETYPQMYVTDSVSKDFYSLDDIASGDVPSWLEV